MEQLSRTEMLFGKEKTDALREKSVIVFGVGGVGGYVCEALVRSGIGRIGIVDNDTVSVSNINRQIIALHSTVGRPKVDVMEERIMDIANDAKQMKGVKTVAQAYAKKAQWKHFFKHYKVAYDIALRQCTMRKL